ncbi:Gfo/Idh/MocA family oxidoreductase [Alicyclobacillus fastidiosus]|uniref:Gfo/Idh/MocA family oxidoreductase n=1 Tax=Alicyclobacillus fastidiosus TaxID=392011 RepID=A0ABY6ZBK4_9BACL|nr:Gfo/Idh/MocA family oxidoreductase [Alicyclobacillus fastidiosus]WAH39922.1 Gfo/Idh/MocA family oxidoreductase [Alicyclobacillus fastidiosus]GMA61199.1 hypothetical protein GCM10025859_16390 [Alicyclobacillus fastidiosus]
MVRVAVVGVNNIGRRHCAIYDQCPDTELAAVCDLVETRVAQAAAEFRTKAYTDLRTLLREEDVDVVSIATSGVEGGSHHYAPAMLAIEAGKDVLVEKPLSNDLVEARTMVQCAREKGVRLACDLNHRFVPAAYKGKELIDKGQLGDLLFVNMRLTIRNPNESSPWFHMRALHAHSIDVMRYFGGDIARVQAFMVKAPGRSVWSTCSVNMQFASGAVGHLTGSYDMSMRHPIEFCEVAGNRGRFVIDNVYENFSFYRHDQDELLVQRNPLFGGIGNFHDTMANRIHHFIHQIQANVSPDRIEGSGKDALAAQAVIEAAIQSHLQNGAVVEVKDGP